jgi:ABC-2 type transport system ATP-binding protein
MWTMIAELVREGTTMLLTTQYLEEADRLVDTIAVVDHGKVIAGGTSDELKSSVGGERVEVTVGEGQLQAAAKALAAHADGEPETDQTTMRVTAPVIRGAAILPEVVRELDAANVDIVDLAVRRPTLDDVFLTLTGHAAEEENGDNEVKDGKVKGGKVKDDKVKVAKRGRGRQ